MLEYFTYKKVKKHQQEKHEHHHDDETIQPPTPILTPNDEAFLQRITSEDDPAASLSTRPLGSVAGDTVGNEQQVALTGATESAEYGSDVRGVNDKSSLRNLKGKATDPSQKRNSRFSFLQRSGTKKDKQGKAPVNPDGTVTPAEAAKENQDIASLLDNLNLSAVNNRAFSLSKESQVLVQKFTVILKDIVNGVPTAYDDLVKLLDESSDVLQKNYKHLPSYLQKLIKTLPAKMSSTLGPEILATAAVAAEGANHSKHGGRSGLRIPSLKDLVTKPGAVVGILKAIMNFLKLRWPAFLGTNVLFSLGLFVLLFVFWYCHKRGRETRLAKEQLDREGNPIDRDRFEELSTDEEDLYDAEHGSSRLSHVHDSHNAHGEGSSRLATPSRGEDDRQEHDRDEDDEELIEGSRARHLAAVDQAKQAKKDRSWEKSPTQAPLNQQESCIVC